MDNPSAFPSRKDEPMVGGGSYRNDAPGMTLRDWFAGLAMIALHARGAGTPPDCRPESLNADADIFYRMADAMLTARSQSIREGVDRD